MRREAHIHSWVAVDRHLANGLVNGRVIGVESAPVIERYFVAGDELILSFTGVKTNLANWERSPEIHKKNASALIDPHFFKAIFRAGRAIPVHQHLRPLNAPRRIVPHLSVAFGDKAAGCADSPDDELSYILLKREASRS